MCMEEKELRVQGKIWIYFSEYSIFNFLAGCWVHRCLLYIIYTYYMHMCNVYIYVYTVSIHTDIYNT